MAVAQAQEVAPLPVPSPSPSSSLPGKVPSEIVVTANRGEQRRFDAAASIDSVAVDSFRAASPLVNLSELLSGVPGLQVRNRENYAQDLQISVRGFGTRSTFGVRGVRILIDGIPATNPDGQGQASTASLTSAKRIEVLRGPVAQLYGNAAGGVVQIFTNDPPVTSGKPRFGATIGAGSDGQRQADINIGGGTETLGALLDVSQYRTDGYRDHSSARRTQINAKVVARPSSDTTITGIFNAFNQPLSQDPLGLTHDQFLANPRQVAPVALTFDTRKKIEQQQAGVVMEKRLSANDSLSARLYGGRRQVFQTLSFSGAAATSSGGVVDLDSAYAGIGASWNHKTSWNAQPVDWTIGVEADTLRQQRQGFVNNKGTPGAIRRDEIDGAGNLDLFGQADWEFSPRWVATAGVRMSRVRLKVDDHYVTAASPNDSGDVNYHNTSPVVGLLWHANDDLNLYANIGRGFETPTLAETAYRVGATGPNLSLNPSRSVQAEIGAKLKQGIHSLDLAIFEARSKDEIVPFVVSNGRSIYQNVDGVERRGMEASWKATGRQIETQLSYTLLDARFKESFVNSAGAAINSGNRLPGAPMHSLFGRVAYHPIAPAMVALEMRAESRAFVDDINSDAAPGYTVFNASTSYEFGTGDAKMLLFARLDNLMDRNYAGSVIVNDGNKRFFEPAAGRRVFVGLRTAF
jgi:iron complex outermembrane receptor protein